jgi:hypothetical protein
MKNSDVKHKAKYYLENYECGMCETCVVQFHQVWKRGGIVTTTVHGCLDCGHEYGIRQAIELNKYHREDIVWP